jgi:hypothetical protein
VSPFSESVCHGSCHLDTAANYHDVNVLAGSFQKEVSHVATHDVGFHMHLVGHLSDEVKNRCRQ